VPKAAFSDKAVPKFPDAPAAILVTGDVEFFVEEAAARTREILSMGKEAEVLRFEDDAPVESVSDALLNRSLFSPQRIVELDISRLLGTEAPGRLLTKAVEAWEAGKRREAFRQARLLLAALDLPLEAPEETAETAARKVRRKDEAELLAEIFKEMPEEKSGGAAILRSALRALIERGENDGTVALMTAVSPPAGVDLVREIADRGLVLETTVGDDAEPALRRLAAARAKEREVVLEPAAVQRLLARTDYRAAPFAMELEKLLEWAGKGGRIRATDIEANVEDESSEDVYAFFDSIGRRDAGDALARLERLLDGRDIRAGDRDFKKIEDIWPIQLLGMLAGEVRRMLLIRARLDEGGASNFDASMSYQTFQARVLPRLMAPAAPFGRSPFETAQGGAHPYGLYQSAKRSSKFTTRQLARALARAADVDVALKNSAPPLETLTVYVGDLIAGR
jgi:DNA polymerase III delta subunit